MKKKVVFYYQDFPQKQLFESISKKLNKKKFNIIFTRDYKITSDFGFYAEDTNRIDEINSKVSFITIGGMDQGKLFWPNLWLKENWNKFDYGILPGQNWANMWKKSTWYDKSHPKKAMLLTGWPKSEGLKNSKKTKSKIILYAPCFETDNKGKDVIDAIKMTKIKILIKHLPWEQTNKDFYKLKDVRKNIKEMQVYAKKMLGNRAIIIDSKENIMKFYSKADVLITDESSVMYEALLFNLPSLSCEDWPMRINNVNKPRKIKKDKNVCNYTIKKDLRKKILLMLSNLRKYQIKSIRNKNKHFSYIHNSASNISLFLDKYPKGKKLFNIKFFDDKNYLKSRFAEFKKFLRTDYKKILYKLN